MAFLSMRKSRHLRASFVSVLSPLRRHTSARCQHFHFFTFGCAGSSLRVGLPLAAVWGLLSSRQAGASPRRDFWLRSAVSGCPGFSSWGAWARSVQLSALEHRPDSGGARASSPHSTWGRPGSGTDLVPLHWQVDSLALRATREALILPILWVSKLRLRKAE